MPTVSNVKESSYRIGCGRYLQEKGAVSLVGEEVLRCGAKKPFIISTKTPLSLTKETIENSLNKAGLRGTYHLYEGFCCKEILDGIIESEEFASCDVVIGVGGGNMMDSAKYLAVKKGIPVINIPTSSASCAAQTPLSVCYTAEGRTVGSVHHKTEVDCVIADTDILCREPVRLFVSGVYDSLAKAIEIEQRLFTMSDEDLDIGLSSAYRLSTFIREFFDKNLDACVKDLREHNPSKVLCDAFWITILLTGVVSGLSRGSNQTAIGHKFYESARRLFPKEVYHFLHGEMVAIGLIVQTAYNGNEDPSLFSSRMKSFGMPVNLSDLGLPDTDETLSKFFDDISSSSAMKGTTNEEKERLRRCLSFIR